MKGFDLTTVDRELKREIFKHSYYEFFRFCFRLLFPNEPYIDSLHVKYLCDTLQYEVLRIIARKPKTNDKIINNDTNLYIHNLLNLEAQISLLVLFRRPLKSQIKNLYVLSSELIVLCPFNY